jgi:hypothetical protein
MLPAVRRELSGMTFETGCSHLRFQDCRKCKDVGGACQCHQGFPCGITKEMNNNEETNNAERVRKLIREAFADVPCPDTFRQFDSCDPPTHDVALIWRQDLYNYEPEEVQYMLPSILEDALDTHPGDDIENEAIELLVLEINPFSIDNDLIRLNRIRLFENFTLQQSKAVCEWLRLARNWKDLAFYTDRVDGAIEYWCNRTAETSPSAGHRVQSTQ